MSAQQSIDSFALDSVTEEELRDGIERKKDGERKA
jgi:hypothetical protein